MVALLALAGFGLDVGALYWLGVAAVAVLLAYEHPLSSSGPADLRRLDAAFFIINGVISIVFFAFVLLDASPLGDAAAPGRPGEKSSHSRSDGVAPRACRCSMAFP